MRGYERTLRSIGFVCLVLMLTICLMTGCRSSGEASVPTEPAGQENGPVEEPTGETQGGTQAPTQPPVMIQMPDYELTYDGEMAQYIRTEELPEQNGLRFSVALSDGEKTIFTLLFNQAEGELVTMLTNEAGEKIPVSFLMEPIPEGLSQEDYDLFCIAQEQVNAIIASIVLK